MMPDLSDPNGLAQAALGVVTAACFRKAGETARRVSLTLTT